MRLETRLHRARVERGIELTELAARTRLSPRAVRSIDEGRFAELPPGPYARSYVRAFASEVGLDPEPILQDLEPVLPTVEDPLDGLREAVRRADASRARTAIRIARIVAVLTDAALLMTLDGVLVLLAAATCGVTVEVLLTRAAPAMTFFCAIPVALYFLVFRGLGGRTPGASLCRLPVAPTASPLGLQQIFARAMLL